MILDKEKKIAYLNFPTKEEELKKARADNYEILDIRFCPAELLKQGGTPAQNPTPNPQGKKGDLLGGIVGTV